MQMTTKSASGRGPVVTRKAFLEGTVAAAGALAAGGLAGLAGPGGPALAAEVATRPIPSSGERIPVVGLGTARVYDVAPDDPKVPVLRATVDAFVKGGGKVIDTSPTYGRSEPMVGRLVGELGARDRLFLATKISTSGEQAGIDSVGVSMRSLGTDRIELLQVHNIKDVGTQLRTIRRLKEAGKVRYAGITISNARAYERFEKLMRSEPLDFIQVNYSLGQPESAERILPLARDKGIAVLVNRPFWLARLFRKAKGHDLPPWSAEFDCKSWAQFFLKFILGHPAVTCAIPGTDRPEYMVDNLGAGIGRMPDQRTRARMLAFWQRL